VFIKTQQMILLP